MKKRFFFLSFWNKNFKLKREKRWKEKWNFDKTRDLRIIGLQNYYLIILLLVFFF